MALPFISLYPYLQNIVFHNLVLGSGSDSSGVPTQMASLNCTVEIEYHNPSKYFGVHVNPVEAAINLSELEVARGEVFAIHSIVCI